MRKLTSLIIALAFIACSTDEDGNADASEKLIPVEIEDLSPFPETELKGLYEALQPAVETFKVSGSEDVLVEAKGGTKVFIPKGAFVNRKGETIEGEVDIEVQEVLDMGSFINSGLQTVSDGQVLVSEGMMYVNAKVAGEQVAIKEGKEIQVELPKINTTDDQAMQIFVGNRDADGNIQWTPESKPETKLICLPLEMFDYRRWYGYWGLHEGDEAYSKRDQFVKWDSLKWKQQKFENTFVATREFDERFWWIASLEANYNYSVNFDYDTDTEILAYNWEFMDSSLFECYLSNLDKTLEYCDSLAYDLIQSDKFKVVSKRWYNDLERYFDRFKLFKEERLGGVIHLDPNIDYGASNARSKILASGKTERQADEILGAYQRQQALIKAKQEEEEARDFQANTFKIAKLGWINCDQFYNDPLAKEANLLATVAGVDGPVSLTLVLNKRKIAINGTDKGNGVYSITGDAAPYTKLPIGEEASIIALSYKDGQPYFAIKKIEITEQDTYDLMLEPTSADDIKKAMRSISAKG